MINHISDFYCIFFADFSNSLKLWFPPCFSSRRRGRGIWNQRPTFHRRGCPRCSDPFNSILSFSLTNTFYFYPHASQKLGRRAFIFLGKIFFCNFRSKGFKQKIIMKFIKQYIFDQFLITVKAINTEMKRFSKAKKSVSFMGIRQCLHWGIG